MPWRVLAIVLVSLAAAGCGGRLDADALRRFVKAEDAFQQAASPADFLHAAGLYQEILDSGIVAGAVLYNQGNAYMQAGQRGRAIAAYRQAQRYRPRDPYLEANLRYALGQAAPTTARPVLEYLLFWQHWLSYPEKFYLLAALAALAFALGLAAAVTGRRLPRRLARTALVLVLLAGVSAGYDVYRYDWLEHGVVVDEQVVARKGNAASYEPALSAPLDCGTEFLVIDRRGDWLLVRLAGGQEGWLETRGVETY